METSGFQGHAGLIKASKSSNINLMFYFLVGLMLRRSSLFFLVARADLEFGLSWIFQ